MKPGSLKAASPMGALVDHLQVCLWEGTHQDDLRLGHILPVPQQGDGGQAGLSLLIPPPPASLRQLPIFQACLFTLFPLLPSPGWQEWMFRRETALLPLPLPASFPSPCPSAPILLSAYMLEQFPSHLLVLNPEWGGWGQAEPTQCLCCSCSPQTVV